jgi:hypothetical protein
VYKWKKSTGESDAQFHDQIRQGCREIRIASVIVRLSDVETYIYRMNGEIRQEVSDSMLQRVRNEAGIKGGEFQLDLAEDPEIKPILKSLRRAKREFSSLYEDEGNASVFTHPTLRIALDPVTNKVIFEKCSDNLARYTFNEGKEDRWLQVLVERVVRPKRIDEADVRPPDVATPAGPPVGSDDSRASIPEAIISLQLRYTPALNIIQRLQDVQRKGSLTTKAVIDIVKPVSKFGKLPMSFPKEDGSITREQPITTQESITPARSAAGIVVYFIMGGRKKAISMDVVRRVADVLGVKFTFNEGDPRPVVDMYKVMLTLKKSGFALEKLSSEAQEALRFVIAAVAEYSGTASGSSSQDGELPGASQFISRASEQYINFLAMQSALRSQNPDIESLKGGVIFEPGRKRRPGEKNVISTIRAYPTLSDIEKNDEFLANAGGEESASSVINSRQAKENLEKLLDMFKTLPKELKSATAPLRRAPVRGHLPAIDFSTRLAAVAGGLRIPAAFRKLGYSSSLLIARDDIEPRDAWILLCESSGAAVGNASSVGKFDASMSYDQLVSDMTGDNLEKVIGKLAAIYTAHYVSPLARVIMHAANTYRDRGLLGLDAHKTMIDRLDKVFAAALLAIQHFVFDAPTTTGVQTASAKFRITRKAVALKKKSTLDLGTVPAEYRTLSRADPLATPIESKGGVDMSLTAESGAPFNVSIMTLSISDDEVGAAAPDASSTPDAPAPAPAPTPATAIAPPTSPTPAPAPASPTPAAPPPAPAPAPIVSVEDDTRLPVTYDKDSIARIALTDSAREKIGVLIRIERDYVLPRGILIFEMEVQMRGGTAQLAASRETPSELRFEGSVLNPSVRRSREAPDYHNALITTTFNKFTSGGTLQELVDAVQVVDSDASLRDLAGNTKGYIVTLIKFDRADEDEDEDEDEDDEGETGDFEASP